MDDELKEKKEECPDQEDRTEAERRPAGAIVETAESRDREKTQPMAFGVAPKDRFCLCGKAKNECFCRGLFCNFILALRVLLSELKWACINGLVKWEQRQLRKRLRKEEEILGRLLSEEALKIGSMEEGSSIEFNSHSILLVRQISFLREELAKSEEDSLQRRKEFIEARKTAFKGDIEENNDYGKQDSGN